MVLGTVIKHIQPWFKVDSHNFTPIINKNKLFNKKRFYSFRIKKLFLL